MVGPKVESMEAQTAALKVARKVVNSADKWVVLMVGRKAVKKADWKVV
jgi:hypothetical protein